MQQLVLKPIRIGGLSVTRFQYHRAIPRGAPVVARVRLIGARDRQSLLDIT
jgi:hypothetical protein